MKEERIKQFLVSNNCFLEKQVDIKEQVACFSFIKLKNLVDEIYQEDFRCYIKKYRFYNMIINYSLNVLEFENKKGNLLNFLYENILELDNFLGDDKEKVFNAIKTNNNNKERLEEVLKKSAFFKDNVIYNLLFYIAYKELIK